VRCLLAHAPLEPAQHRRLRVGDSQRLDRRAVEGEVRAGPGSDLEHAAGRAREQLLAESAQPRVLDLGDRAVVRQCEESAAQAHGVGQMVHTGASSSPTRMSPGSATRAPIARHASRSRAIVRRTLRSRSTPPACARVVITHRSRRMPTSKVAHRRRPSTRRARLRLALEKDRLRETASDPTIRSSQSTRTKHAHRRCRGTPRRDPRTASSRSCAPARRSSTFS